MLSTAAAKDTRQRPKLKAVIVTVFVAHLPPFLGVFISEIFMSLRLLASLSLTSELPIGKIGDSSMQVVCVQH